MLILINIAVNLIRLATAIRKETKTHSINKRFGLDGRTIERYNSINMENSGLYSIDVTGNANINTMPISTQSLGHIDNFFIIMTIEYMSRQCTNKWKIAVISHVLNSQKIG
jgi:hypothetical protein